MRSRCRTRCFKVYQKQKLEDEKPYNIKTYNARKQSPSVGASARLERSERALGNRMGVSLDRFWSCIQCFSNNVVYCVGTSQQEEKVWSKALCDRYKLSAVDFGGYTGVVSID